VNTPRSRRAPVAGSGPRGCDHHGALRPFPLAARAYLRRKDAFGRALRLNRSVTWLRSGDLTKRLVIPALYNLSRTHQQERNDVH
jgi:hypothetical protein